MNIKEIGLWFAAILVLVLVITISSSIRLSNFDLLTDSTTGEKIPLALDPYYFLRISETIVETNGDLPEFDSPHNAMIASVGIPLYTSPDRIPFNAYECVDRYSDGN